MSLSKVETYDQELQYTDSEVECELGETYFWPRHAQKLPELVNSPPPFAFKYLNGNIKYLGKHDEAQKHFKATLANTLAKEFAHEDDSVETTEKESAHMQSMRGIEALSTEEPKDMVVSNTHARYWRNVIKNPPKNPVALALDKEFEYKLGSGNRNLLFPVRHHSYYSSRHKPNNPVNHTKKDGECSTLCSGPQPHNRYSHKLSVGRLIETSINEEAEPDKPDADSILHVFDYSLEPLTSNKQDVHSPDRSSDIPRGRELLSILGLSLD